MQWVSGFEIKVAIEFGRVLLFAVEVSFVDIGAIVLVLALVVVHVALLILVVVVGVALGWLAVWLVDWLLVVGWLLACWICLLPVCWIVWLLVCLLACYCCCFVFCLLVCSVVFMVDAIGAVLLLSLLMLLVL